MALFFLKMVQKQWGEKKIQATVPEIRKILEVVLPRMEWDEQMRLIDKIMVHNDYFIVEFNSGIEIQIE